MVAAAERRPDVCENDPALARALNVDALRLIAECRAANSARGCCRSRPITSSTARDRPISPTIAPSPLNAYGHSKLEGERALLNRADAPACCVCRCFTVRCIDWSESAVTSLTPAIVKSAVAARRARVDGRVGDALPDLHARRRGRDPADARASRARRSDLRHHAMVRRRTDDEVRHRASASRKRCKSKRSSSRSHADRFDAAPARLSSGFGLRSKRLGIGRRTPFDMAIAQVLANYPDPRSPISVKIPARRGEPAEQCAVIFEPLRDQMPHVALASARRRTPPAATRRAAPCAAFRRAPARRSH